MKTLYRIYTDNDYGENGVVFGSHESAMSWLRNHPKINADLVTEGETLDHWISQGWVIIDRLEYVE